MLTGGLAWTSESLANKEGGGQSVPSFGFWVAERTGSASTFRQPERHRNWPQKNSVALGTPGCPSTTRDRATAEFHGNSGNSATKPRRQAP